MDQKELGHDGLTEMVLVDSMHQRKLKMAELAEGFIALPGGLGTLEELAEILTWVQLQLVNKPVGLLNVDGYYHHLINMLETMVENAFLRKENKENLLISDDAAGLLDEMKGHPGQKGQEASETDSKAGRLAGTETVEDGRKGNPVPPRWRRCQGRSCALGAGARCRSEAHPHASGTRANGCERSGGRSRDRRSEPIPSTNGTIGGS